MPNFSKGPDLIRSVFATFELVGSHNSPFTERSFTVSLFGKIYNAEVKQHITAFVSGSLMDRAYTVRVEKRR